MTDLGTLGGPDSFVAGLCDERRTELVPGASFTNSTQNPLPGSQRYTRSYGKTVSLLTS